MPTIRAYHRPATLDEALALVSRADGDATLLAGGTVLNGLPDEHPIDVVDLQALGMDGFTVAGERLEIGAMARLQQLATHDLVPGMLRDLAHREAPNTIRNAATIGGTVAGADWESELLAGLLAFEADVTVVHGIGAETIALTELLDERDRLGLGIITTVSIAVGGDAAAARTGRTPADRPIVAVVGRRSDDGRLLIAATGVAETPVLIDAAGALDPPADFRGSADYRRHLAATLRQRVTTRLGETV
ncbi:MAG: hypothetical protein HKN74_04235 [Acidimicrobiia bacterium]|nr:FAD binding domain-containing protein [Acidimicrobiia bacterium]NNF09474.1 hypothetical protein [Acidimicrobiia bacterium]NNL70053.1 hypothetical protein [Acidimicrobiia bacterium]